jgi:hypothetical protein
LEGSVTVVGYAYKMSYKAFDCDNYRTMKTERSTETIPTYLTLRRQCICCFIASPKTCNISCQVRRGRSQLYVNNYINIRFFRDLMICTSLSSNLTSLFHSSWSNWPPSIKTKQHSRWYSLTLFNRAGLILPQILIPEGASSRVKGS